MQINSSATLPAPPRDVEHMFLVAGKCLLQELKAPRSQCGTCCEKQIKGSLWLEPLEAPPARRRHLSPFPMWLELLRLFA